MGFIVGCVIVYQVIYSDVSDHLPEYATLMAMGYPLSNLLGVVAREGLYLAVFGYLPAYVAGEGALLARSLGYQVARCDGCQPCLHCVQHDFGDVYGFGCIGYASFG